MKAFGFNQFGSADVFEELTSENLTPKKGRVIVQTHAFAMNPFDRKMRQGEVKMKQPPFFPIIPGSDISGTVIDKAADVSEFHIGDEVIGRVISGGYAQQVSVPHLKLVLKPHNLSFTEAAGIPNAGITAYDILKGALNLEHVTSILVLGASGAVGAFLVQIARATGLFVAATASSKHAKFVKNLGVDLFIPTEQLTKRNFLDDAPVDVLINATPATFDNKLGNNRWLKPDGQLVSLNGFSPTFKAVSNQQQLTDFNDAAFHQNRKALVYLTELVKHNQLKVPIARTYPFTLDGVIQGQKLLDAHHTPGKIVITQEAPNK